VIVELRKKHERGSASRPAWNNVRDTPGMELSKDSDDKQKHVSNKLLLLKKTIIEMGSKVSRSKMLEYITENAATVFEADGSAIYLYDSALDELTLVTVYNLRPNLVGTKIKADSGLLGKVVRNLTPMKIDDYTAWPERIKTFEEDRYRALLEAPIIWRDNLFGVIGLVRTGDAKPFDDFDLNLLAIFAIQIGVVLSNPELRD
jgi:signal transduction protein with GAF and PtsI domain